MKSFQPICVSRWHKLYLKLEGARGLYVLMPEKYLDGLYERFVDMLNMELGNPNPDTSEASVSEGFDYWVM